ncbi:hypothetical protein ACFY1U_12170 [Streptomyces sp. NPDC001351]|uniref:hypothetical protein n=1 Tax=Streptomyces sp. NPDC001351 TaxID=3364564 RepID=UPI0036A42D06
MEGGHRAGLHGRPQQVETSLDARRPGFEAGHPAAGERDGAGLGPEEADVLLEPAVLDPERVIDPRTGQVDPAGYPRARERQGAHRAGLHGVRAEQQRDDHFGPDGPPGPPLPAARHTVVLGHAGPQIHAAPFGERVPQLTLGWRQFVV